MICGRVTPFTRPLLLVLTLAASGCVSVAYRSDPLALYMSQSPDQALASFETLDYKSRDQALYHLDKAVLLRMNQDYSRSNNELEAAKKISEQLDALSVREQAAAVTVNDAMRSYLPPPFERVMLYCLKVLNYLQLGDLDGARVEALQLDVFLKQKYEKQEPAFARYLIGVVFDSNHELSDALIAYRMAYEAYHANALPVPIQLQADLLRLTDRQGLREEHEKYIDEFSLDQWLDQDALEQQGELIAVVFSGLVPRKFETAINTQSPMSGQLHRIAIPAYEERAAQVTNFEVQMGAERYGSETLARIDTLAYDTLAQQMPGIISRAIARVAVKDKMSDNVAERDPLLGMITNIAGFISEQADTRGWYSLPLQILLCRVSMAPGDYNTEIKLMSDGTSVALHSLDSITMQARQKHFFSWHWPASHVSNRRHHDANISYSATIHHRID